METTAVVAESVETTAVLMVKTAATSRMAEMMEAT
jgi:hypothetical protein